MHVTYLDPRKYYSNQRLDDIMLLVPSYVQPDVRTHGCIDQLIRLGADITSSYGCSDPALHRCLVAGRAMSQIESHPEKYKYVCWIDDDMVFSPSHLMFLRQSAMALSASVTGIYCRRGDPTTACVRHIPSQHPPICERNTLLFSEGEQASFTAYPVTAGMGCLLVPVEDFMRHCASCPVADISLNTGEKTVVVGVCSSQMGGVPGAFGWVSEDESYCEGLWIHGGGVWSVPIAFGHMSTVPLAPDPDACWLGEVRAGSAQQSPSI